MKDNELLGVMAPKVQVVEQLPILRKILETQRQETERKLALVESEVKKYQEYLAKIEGGIDVLDQLEA